MAALRLGLAGRASPLRVQPCVGRRVRAGVCSLYHHLDIREVDVTGSAAGKPGSRLEIPQEVLRRFCEQHHIRRISLFGSIVRGEERPDSDIDLLVEFDPGQTPGYIALAGMEAELSELLGGRRVDLRTQADLSRYFREDVMREAELQHAR